MFQDKCFYREILFTREYFKIIRLTEDVHLSKMHFSAPLPFASLSKEKQESKRREVLCKAYIVLHTPFAKIVLYSLKLKIQNVSRFAHKKYASRVKENTLPQ